MNLAERIADFEVWHYEFDLDGLKTPIYDRRLINRHSERKRYFFDPVVELLGGLEGKRVLDLGCNAGYWSLAALEAGAEFVLGVDGRQMHVDQAELVFGAKGIPRERYEFRTANVFDFDPDGTFDLVLCLGLLYHVNRPFTLIERIAVWNTDLLVIDTDLSVRPGSLLEVKHEPTDNPRASVDFELILWPTKQAVIDLVRAFGYDAVALRPRFKSWEACHDFRARRRRAFVCSKRTPLVGLDTELVRPWNDLAVAAARDLPVKVRNAVGRTRGRLGASKARLRARSG